MDLSKYWKYKLKTIFKYCKISIVTALWNTYSILPFHESVSAIIFNRLWHVYYTANIILMRPVKKWNFKILASFIRYESKKGEIAQNIFHLQLISCHFKIPLILFVTLGADKAGKEGKLNLGKQENNICESVQIVWIILIEVVFRA